MEPISRKEPVNEDTTPDPITMSTNRVQSILPSRAERRAVSGCLASILTQATIQSPGKRGSKMALVLRRCIGLSRFTTMRVCGGCNLAAMHETSDCHKNVTLVAANGGKA
jgi:hypothetical protein